MGCICPSRESPQPRNTLVYVSINISRKFYSRRSLLGRPERKTFKSLFPLTGRGFLWIKEVCKGVCKVAANCRKFAKGIARSLQIAGGLQSEL